MSNITIIGINYYPEDSAIGLYTTQMAEFLSESGYNVNIITGFPYYPQWEIWSEYKNKPNFFREKYNKINILRYKQFVPSNPTFLKRVFHILSFTFGSFINLFKIKKVDLVICIVPVTSSIFLGKLLALLKGAKLWVHIQDFEFDAAIESGITKNNKVKKLLFYTLFFVEKVLLNRADIVSSISFGMLKKLSTKSKSESYYLPNWIDENFLKSIGKISHPYFDKEKFSILYSGNIGEKQDWNLYLKVIKELRNDNSIEFVLVGDGAKKKWLVDEITKLKNVKYFEPVKYSDLPNLLKSADAHILLQKNTVLDTVMPSKLLGMMLSGKPSIITGNKISEVASIFSKIGCKGFLSNDKNEIINFIYQLKNDIELCKKIGIIEKKYIEENFLKSKILKRFNDKIIKLMK